MASGASGTFGASASSSALGRVARAAFVRWRAEWRAQSDTARATFRRTLIGGAVALPAFTLALVALARRMQEAGVLACERAWLQRLVASDFSFSSALWFQTLGSDLPLAILLLSAAGFALYRGRPMLALAFPLAWIGVDLAVRLGWAVWARDRPDLVFGGDAAPGFHAFPSGHSGKTFAAWGLITWVWVRASRSWIERTLAIVGFVCLAVVVPVSRMRMGAHWPSDVVGGALIGCAWLVVLIVAMRGETAAQTPNQTPASTIATPRAPRPR